MIRSSRVTHGARVLALALGLAMTASACGSGDSASPVEVSPSEAQGDIFPQVDVMNVSTEATANLGTILSGGDQAILIWFWAPH